MDELRSQLREAFAARLEVVSPERVDNIRNFDYLGHRKTRSKMTAWTAAFGTALAGASTAVALWLSAGAPPAFAGWSPVPTTPTPAALAKATSACDWAHNPTGPPILTGRPVLTDQRGIYTAALFADKEVLHICISDGKHHGGTVLAMSQAGPRFQPPGRDQLTPPVGFGGGAPGFPGSDGVGYEMNISGLVGADVEAVHFKLANGTVVDATVRAGRYFAWWPSSSSPRSVQVTSGDGTRSATVGSICKSHQTQCVFAAHTQAPGQNR